VVVVRCGAYDIYKGYARVFYFQRAPKTTLLCLLDQPQKNELNVGLSGFDLENCLVLSRSESNLEKSPEYYTMCDICMRRAKR
jgi:hypothetical protein